MWPPRPPDALLPLAPLAALALGGAACSTLPEGRLYVESVAIEGNDLVDSEDIEEKIAAQPTSSLLGLFPGLIYGYELYDRLALQRDVARIERYYRARGHYDAHVRAARVRMPGTDRVRITIEVEEGQPVVVESVAGEGLGALPTRVASRAMQAARALLPVGEVFDEARLDRATDTLERELVEQGHAFAQVERDAVVDVGARRASVLFQVDPGPPSRFGPITIAGLGALPEAPLRRALDIEVGQPYSASAIGEAQQAALDLGVLSSIEVVPDFSDPASATVPLLVRVQPTRLRTVRLGGGIELDALKANVHALAGWENRNFFGGLRTFSVELRPGIVFYPVRIGALGWPERLLPEGRLRLELRQPGFLEARTQAFVRPELNIVPVLLKADIDPADPILGYRELDVATGLDRTFGKLYSALSYHLQIEDPFTYKGDLDPALRALLVSYVELFGSLDLRDDRVKPHRGGYLSSSLQVAGGLLRGDASDVKVHPEARAYVPLARRWTLALRAGLGLLFPFNYGDIVATRLDQPFTEPERPARVRDLQLAFFRGFFSGGPSSNRGYSLRGVGPRGVVPFLSPQIEAQQIAQACELLNPNYTASRCAIPIGGFTLWEASTEIRFPIGHGPFSGAVFCDASDVSPRTANVRLHRPHLSCGAGARYDTPVGPVRVDLGYRLPGLQVLGPKTPRDIEPNTLFGLPIALSLGLGEAF